MNPKKQSTSPKSVGFEDLSTIEAKVNAITASPKITLSEARKNIFTGPSLKLDIKEIPTNTKDNVQPNIQPSNLGASTAENEKKLRLGMVIRNLIIYPLILMPE